MSDFNIINSGSIVMIAPLTDAAREWVDEHIGEDNGYQPYYPTFIAEPRYVYEIIEGIVDDGLSVENEHGVQAVLPSAT